MFSVMLVLWKFYELISQCILALGGTVGSIFLEKGLEIFENYAYNFSPYLKICAGC